MDTQEAGRNHLIHGHVFVPPNALVFVRRDTSQSFTAKRRDMDIPAFDRTINTINAMIGELQVELGVTDDDLHAFANTGLSLASKSPTSPQAPASKRGK